MVGRQALGPHNRKKTHCPKGHPYSGENLLLYFPKKGYKRRICRQCTAEKSKVRYWTKIKAIKHPGRPGRPRKDLSKKGRS